MQQLTDLIRPLNAPYTDEVALARIRALNRLYLRCDEDENQAQLVCELSRRSFWYHLALLVWTHDEKALRMGVKPFSPLACYATVAQFLDERAPDGTWAHPVVCGDKSRQLMMSWFAIARLDWICIHRRHSLCPVISKNEEDAAVLLQRVKTINEHYPAFFKRIAGMHGVRVLKGNAYYPNASIIEALAQKSGQAIRSRVPTAVLMDEAAFQDSFERNWTSVKGTCDSRTQLMAVSTANSSHFQLLIEDHLDGRRGGKGTVHHSSTGLEIWTNRNNLVDCVRMHYTADPARRTPEWKRQAKRGMAMHQWRQEQEIDYAARGGQPIFKMLDRSVHVTEGHIEVVKIGSRFGLRIEGYSETHGLRPVRLMRAIDHGTTNFCACVWVAVDEDLDWFVYRVYKRKGWFAPENAAAIARLSRGETYVVDVIDAMQGLPDKRGHVEDIYREYTDDDGRRPLAGLEPVVKGPNSRQEGLDAIGTMLHSTLSVCAPDAPYWALEEYEDWHRQSFAEYSSLYLARDAAEPLFAELDEARWDEPKHGDPLLAQPETSVDMMDDAIDCLRYAIRAAGPAFFRQNKTVRLEAAAAS